MTTLPLITALLVPLLLGMPVLGFLGLHWRGDRVGFLAWSWMVGCLTLCALLRLLRESGLPHEVWWYSAFACALVLMFLRLRRGRPQQLEEQPVGRGFAVFVLVGVAISLWFALAGMDRPCIEGDEGNIWSLKAKSLLVDWGDGFAAVQVYNLHPDYPQLNPWLQAWVYALTGVPEFVQFENRWPIQLGNVAMFVAVAAALRHRLAAWIAVTLASLVLFEPEFQSLCRTAYADGMVALGLVVALDGFLRWRDTEHRGYAWLAALGLAFAAWSKNETMLYLASCGIAAVMTRAWIRPAVGGWARRNVVLLVPVLAVIGSTMVWNWRFGLESDLFGANPTGKSMFALMAEQWPERVPALLAEAWDATLGLGHAHAAFVALLLAAVFVPRLAFGARFALPLLALFGGLAGLHVVYVGSFLPLRFHLDTSYLRVTFQLLPVAIVLLGALVAASRARQTASPA